MPHTVLRSAAVVPFLTAVLVLGGSIGASEPGAPDVGPGGAVARLLAGEASLAEVPDLRIGVGCLTDDGWQTFDLHGDGLGFWGERTQVRVPRERVRDLLAAFRQAGFGEMAESYGRTPGGPKTPPAPEAEGQPARLICQVLLAAGGESKEVRQFDKGPLSEALRKLAYEVLAVGREAAAEGVTVAGLEEGLRKVAAGELDPRGMAVQVQRRFGDPADVERGGWILRLDGRRAELQRITAEGLASPEVLEVASERLRAVAGALAERDVPSLPGNLWAEHYTDLRVSVLGHTHAVQARRFAGMTRGTHGERQEDFEAAFAALRSLAESMGLAEETRAEGDGTR